ncbi:MAG: phage terminase small subunit P27 family [Anaerolineaceae bacterium]
MPTKHVSAEVMESGDSSKHWTKEEIEARKASEALVKRKTKKTINAPSWLSKKAKETWNRIIHSVDGIELLDNMDTEILAMYCDAYAEYTILSQQKNKSTDDIKAMQAYSRIVISYAEKLGLTPSARARLVKKHADQVLDKFGEKFD